MTGLQITGRKQYICMLYVCVYVCCCSNFLWTFYFDWWLFFITLIVNIYKLKSLLQTNSWFKIRNSSFQSSRCSANSLITKSLYLLNQLPNTSNCFKNSQFPNDIRGRIQHPKYATRSVNTSGLTHFNTWLVFFL